MSPSTSIDLVTLVVLVITAVVLWVTKKVFEHQINESRRASEASIFATAVGIMQDPAIRDARNKVFTIDEMKPVSRWTAEERAAAEKVCQAYDSIGVMIRHNMMGFPRFDGQKD